MEDIGLTNIEVSSSVRPLVSKPVGECVSAREPKDTFDGFAQGKSPCEVDINEGLVDGRVGSEVVLKSEENNNGGTCDMLC